MRHRVFQINTSRGGVPKLPVPSADVGSEGITVDRQRDRRFHGGPQRALCLFAHERIVALQQEGHPIVPGSTGENITTNGIDPERLVPGVRLRLGDELEIELTSYTVPCRTIAASFAGGESTRISQKLHPGWSRMYARVLSPGTVRTGDSIAFID